MKNADNSAMALNKKSIKEHRAIMIKSFLKNKLAVAGLIIVVVMVLAAVLAPVITKYDPYEMDIQNRLAAPGNGHLFGTDTFGRDVFSRVIYGLRISLYVGFAIAIIAMVFGLIIGLLSAYFPKADVVLMRICEAMMSIPATLMAIAMMAALGAKTENVIISLSIIYMPTIAKIARASALSVKEMSYIEAIKAQGASWMRIIFRHIAPNVMSPVRYEGEILFEGENLLKLPEKKMEAIRGNSIAMIFQDALSSLNPLYTVGNQIAETVMKHQHLSKKEALKVAEEMLRLTGIPAPEERIYSYPHEMSGGMRQRAMIAMALSCKPKLLIADEPTTALDVTIQAQILKLITDLNKELGMGIMLITHDLGVVAQTCQRVIVMYLGHIVEEGTVDDIFDRPLHPYTIGLIKSIPRMTTKKGEKLYMIKGMVPQLSEVGSGCRFASRCPYCTEECKIHDPELRTVNETQKVCCLHANEF